MGKWKFIRIVLIKAHCQPVQLIMLRGDSVAVQPARLHNVELFEPRRDVERIQQSSVFNGLNADQAVLSIVHAKSLYQDPGGVPVAVEGLHNRVEMLVRYYAGNFASSGQLQFEGHSVLIEFRNRATDAHFSR